MQIPKKWLSHACLYINSHSIKTIRPTEKLFYTITCHKIPIQMM